MLPRFRTCLAAAGLALIAATAVGASTTRWQPYPPGVGGPWGGSVRRLVSPGDPANPSDPRWNELWAATGGGVFSSSDGGATWAARNGDLEDLDVTDIAVFPSTPFRVVIATANGGAFLSTDEGVTWRSLGITTPVWRVAIDPGNWNHLFAACFGASEAVLESFDGGVTWAALEVFSVTRFAFAADRTLYASTRTGRIYRYGLFDSAPVLIHRLAAVEIVELVLPGNDGSTLVAAQGGEGLWVGDDGGDGWEPLSARVNDSWAEVAGLAEFLEIDAVAADRWDASGQRLVYRVHDPLAGAASAFYESPDLGATVSPVDLPEAGMELAQVFICPGAEWLCAEKAGAFRRTGRTGLFTHASRGLAAYVATDLAFAPDRLGGLLVAGGGVGQGGGGLYRWDSAEALWHRIAAAFGAPIVRPPDPAAPGPTVGAFPAASTELVRYRGRELWVGVRGYGPYRSLNAGATWEYRGVGLGHSARQALSGLIFAAAQPEGMVAGTGAGVYFTRNGGLQWTLGTGIPTTLDWCVVRDVRSPSGFFAGGRDSEGGVFAQTNDGGATWAEPVPDPDAFFGSNGRILSLAASSDLDGHVFAGTAFAGLFESFDGGQTWSAAGGGFPALGEVRTLALAEESGDRWAAAAVGGRVQVTSDGGTSWRQVADGLPAPGGVPLAVNGLAFYPGSPRLVAALHGRGLWYLDVEPVEPVAFLLGTPASPTNQTSATLTVAGLEVVSYRYRFDGGGYSAVTPVATPIALTGLADGVHTVEVLGADALGNEQPAALATAVIWTVDTTPPTATLSGAPTGATNQTSVTLTVAGLDVASYRYRLDGGVYSAATPVAMPIALTGLPDGVHEVQVVGSDAVGNGQPEISATAVTWTVDTIPPTATLSGVPTGPTNQTAATLSVGGLDVVTYRYRLAEGDYSAAAPAATPITLIGLADGVHTVRVVGSDAVGNEQPESAATAATWTVDTLPPTATVSGVPTGVTNQRDATLTVRGADVVRYRYRLGGGAYSAATAVATPVTLTNLPDGEHTVQVVGSDAAGNEQPENAATAATWTVDATPPTAVVTGAPTGITNQTSATLTVAGADVVSYRYRLDGGAYSAATPVATQILLTELAGGSHTVAVLGADALGNEQPEGSATVVTWIVEVPVPEPAGGGGCFLTVLAGN